MIHVDRGTWSLPALTSEKMSSKGLKIVKDGVILAERLLMVDMSATKDARSTLSSSTGIHDVFA
jgi:hypothetical protein